MNSSSLDEMKRKVTQRIESERAKEQLVEARRAEADKQLAALRSKADELNLARLIEQSIETVNQGLVQIGAPDRIALKGQSDPKAPLFSTEFTYSRNGAFSTYRLDLTKVGNLVVALRVSNMGLAYAGEFKLPLGKVCEEALTCLLATVVSFHQPAAA